MEFVYVVLKGDEFLEVDLGKGHDKARAEKKEYLNADSITEVY